MPGSSLTMWGMASFTRAQGPHLPADYMQSIEQIDPQIIARTLDEGAGTEHIELLDVLYELMERQLYPHKDELNDDEHTEVAWALEDGAYSVTRIRHDSPLYRALFQRFNGNGRALTDALAPSIIDELSGDLYVLASPEALTQRLTEILERPPLVIPRLLIAGAQRMHTDPTHSHSVTKNAASSFGISRHVNAWFQWHPKAADR